VENHSKNTIIQSHLKLQINEKNCVGKLRMIESAKGMKNVKLFKLE
jgi:hypothetical protein